jgi:galactokinase
MYGAHAGYTDCGLGTKETDLLVELVQAKRGKDLLGAKITGGGAGGTVAILGRSTKLANEAISEIIALYQKQTGIEPYLFTGSSQGADAFGVMVI